MPVLVQIKGIQTKREGRGWCVRGTVPPIAAPHAVRGAMLFSSQIQNIVAYKLL